MHPNIKKIYLVAGIIFGGLWLAYLIGLLEVGYVGFFFLVIFTLIYLMSLISKPLSRDSDFSLESGRQGP